MSEYESVIVAGPSTEPAAEKERALLVGVERPGQTWSLESSLDELARLADTAGAEVVGTTSQKLASLNPRTFVGSGKAEEIAALARTLEVDVVIFDDELTPSQQSNLEKIVDRNVKVIDRTALILDIFALHATSKEGRLQVRLAQNQYLYPRLRGMWAHLASNRMGGGVGSRFGEGESQLEVDRRMVRKRITSIKHELAHLSNVRSLQRENRYGSGLFKVSLAGYTNAGKSSLLNQLTDAGVLSYDKLFATLDSTTRKFELPEGRNITITDTVGFIQKLPTTLVEAFKSTLDEISGSDLILHVIDSSSPEFAHQIDAVHDILGQIHAEAIPCVEVFNKVDLLDEETLQALRLRYPHAVFISAFTGEHIDDLIMRICSCASAADKHIRILVPFSRGDIVSQAHERCHIISTEHIERGTLLDVLVPQRFYDVFKPFEQVGKE